MKLCHFCKASGYYTCRHCGRKVCFARHSRDQDERHRTAICTRCEDYLARQNA
jgi:DNA-directed RNA polymerase subunit RPC12/RpoP